MKLLSRPIAYHAVACAALLAMLVGCSSAPQKFNINVALDEASLRDPSTGVLPSIEVDLVGINASDAPQWESYPISQYFDPNDPEGRRKGCESYRVTFEFNNNDSSAKTLSASDAVWEKWVGRSGRGAQWVYVLAKIRWIEDKPGAQDPRRVIIPLAGNRWSFNWFRARELRIEVQKSGLSNLTPPNPPG